MKLKLNNITNKLPILLLSISLTAKAGYRDAFTEPLAGDDRGGAQTLLGAADIVAAVVTTIVWAEKNDKLNIRQDSYQAEVDKLATAKRNAEIELAKAESLMTYEERQKMVANMNKEVGKLQGTADYESLYRKYSDDVAKIEKIPVVTSQEKQLAIKTAKINLNQIRFNLVQGYMKVGKVKGYKAAFLIGDVIFISDIAHRIYIYNSLGKDPTFSPSMTLIFKNIFGDAKGQ